MRSLSVLRLRLVGLVEESCKGSMLLLPWKKKGIGQCWIGLGRGGGKVASILVSNNRPEGF